MAEVLCKPRFQAGQEPFTALELDRLGLCVAGKPPPVPVPSLTGWAGSFNLGA